MSIIFFLLCVWNRMDLIEGYIYVRDNELCRLKNVYKVGITTSIPNRHDTYLTYEHAPGTFIYVIGVPVDQLASIDLLLKEHLEPFHNYVIGGGTEYYERCVLEQIEPCLLKLGLVYRVLSLAEIDSLQRKRYESNSENEKEKEELQLVQGLSLESKREIIPACHQQEVLDIIRDFYSKHRIGKLIWACGLGKALLGLLIVERMGCQKVLIGVPSNQLQKQMAKEILRLFPDSNNILLVGGEKSCTKSDIRQFLYGEVNSEGCPKFIISTYHSCHLLVDERIAFDFKIGDEAHHLVGLVQEEEERTRCFRLFHKIAATYTLFMTATAKTMNSASDACYSMDNETVFGTLIDVKSVRWAIENRKITDYNVVILRNTEDQVDLILRGLKGLNHTGLNKELFLSCYMCLKSFEMYGNLSHVLLYTNTVEEAELAQRYIADILSLQSLAFAFPRQQVYNRALYSNLAGLDMDSEVVQFKAAPYGIISCVYIFGEGFDLPKLNGVCIAGNMRSETRIVQYLLRPNRLERGNPSKIAYVIIPYMDTGNDWDANNRSFDKVRNIVWHMRNVDENIEQKLVLRSREKEASKEKEKEKEDGKPREKSHFLDTEYCYTSDEDELKHLKLRLRYSKALKSAYTEEQDEYNYVQSLNRTLGIQSKKEYIGAKHMHAHYVEEPEQYFKLKGVWKGWYDFMGMDTSKFIALKTDWISFCGEKSIRSVDDYNKACEEYDVLPKEPALFYMDFTNIASELRLSSSKRR